MSVSRIKQIKNIIHNTDVRDPRAALIAIEKVLQEPKPKKPKKESVAPAILQLTLVKLADSTTGCAVSFDPDQLKPAHVITALTALDEFGQDKFGTSTQCDDPDCPVHGTKKTIAGTPVVTLINELFKQFEGEAIKAAGVKKGGA